MINYSDYTLKQFCCAFDLKTGTIIIAAAHFIILNSILYSWDQYPGEKIFWTIVQALSTIALVVGVIKNNYLLYVPWIVVVFPSAAAIVIFLAFLALVLFAFVAPLDYVVTRWIIISTMQNSIWGPIHAVTFNTVVFMLTMAHLKAVLSDPGKVPLPQSRLDFSDLHSLETSKKTDMEREEWTVCTRCETYRPPRAHHCRICKRCIRKLDHHCPWINNCVGERNQKYFLQFLVYVGILAIYSVALVVGSWIYPCDTCSPDLPESQTRMLHSVLLLLESGLFGLFVIAIMVDQMHAILYDETAIEALQLKGYRHQYRPKLMLLKDVCGAQPALWLLPCSSIGNKKYDYDMPLLTHDV